MSALWIGLAVVVGVVIGGVEALKQVPFPEQRWVMPDTPAQERRSEAA